jgi:outer membrane protein
VANAYLLVLFAKENIDLANKQMELSKQQLDQMNKFIRAGVRPESERLNLEAQIKQSEQGIIEADNELEIRMLDLKQLLRLPPDEDMEIIVPENIIVTTDPEMISFAEAFAEAKKSRPDLRAGDLRVKSAELDVKIAQGNFYPNLGLGGSLNTNYAKASGFSADSYTTQLDANLSYGFGASVNIPLYNNGNVRSNVQRAKIGVENALFQYEQIIENLKTSVQQALANARASKKKLEASEKALEAQNLAFENTTKRLDVGAANTFEWESQKTQMENAEISRLIDKYNYLFNIKILEFYLGKPLKL